MDRDEPHVYTGDFVILAGEDTGLYGFGDFEVARDTLIQRDITANNNAIFNVTANSSATFGVAAGASTGSVTFNSDTAANTMVWSYDNPGMTISTTTGNTALTIAGVAGETALNVSEGNASITKDLDVNGATTLDQTTIDVTDGQFTVNGSTNGISMDVDAAITLTAGAASTWKTEAGNLNISADTGVVNVTGNQGANITATNNNVVVTASGAGGDISLTANDTATMTATNGLASVIGTGATINSTNAQLSLISGTGNIVATGTNLDVDMTGPITIDTTNAGGVAIGVVNNVPISIGNAASTTTVNGNLIVNGTATTVNSTTYLNSDNLIVLHSGATTATADGGILVQRFQADNDTATGVVVADTADQTSAQHATDTFVVSSTGTTVVFNNNGATAPSAVDDFYNGWWIEITGGTGANQVRQITDYVGATRTATVSSAWTTNPTNGGSSTYELYAGTYQAMFYDESADEWAIARVPLDPGLGEIDPVNYSNLHVNNLTVNGNLSFTGFQTETVTLTANGTYVAIPNTGTRGAYFATVTGTGDDNNCSLFSFVKAQISSSGSANRIDRSQPSGNTRVNARWLAAANSPELAHGNASAGDLVGQVYTVVLIGTGSS